MARQVAPGTPTEIKAQQFKVPDMDFSDFEKMGDAKINAANNNFKLYAEAITSSESAKIYEQFKNDPEKLATALGKVPEIISDLPQEIQDQMKKKLYLNSVSLVAKAQSNRIALEDKQNKQYTDTSITANKADMLANYGNVLQNHISKAEDKNPVMNDIFIQQLDNLQTLSELKTSNGTDAYSEAQKKAIRDISDLELEGFKQFIDRMILNDNDDLENTKNYYEKFILAPDRFMAENYMNRDTYEKARAYAKKQLEQAGADIKNARFNQSIREATELQVADLPGKLKSLKEAGLIDSTIIKSIEKTNTKFNEIDPSKPELPTTMIEMLGIVNGWEKNPVPTTEAERLEVLTQGTAALDAIADYGQTYGLSPRSVYKARQMVVMKEQDRAYGQMLDNFGRITQSFANQIQDMNKKLNYIRATAGAEVKGEYKVPTDAELVMLTDLNNALAYAEDASREALRQGDINTYNKIQQELTQTVAEIKYRGKITPTEWAVWRKDPEKVFNVQGISFQIAGFTPDGDIITK